MGQNTGDTASALPQAGISPKTVSSLFNTTHWGTVAREESSVQKKIFRRDDGERSLTQTIPEATALSDKEKFIGAVSAPPLLYAL